MSTEYVHLCSEELEKSWSVRQVSTSNEVYVVQATCAGQDSADEDIDMIDTGQHAAIMTAIAKTDSMLELLPATIDIEGYLCKLLPTYNQDQLAQHFENGSTQSFDEEQDDSRSMFSQIPTPDTSIRKAWKQLCVSRSPQLSAEARIQYFIPTAQLLESAWKSVYAAYSIRTSGKGAMTRDDFEDDGDDELLTVKMAIWDLLRSDDGLNRTKTVAWVVRVLWDVVGTSGASGKVSRDDLEDIWRNHLPWEWIHDATIDKLEAGTYELYTDGGQELVRWIDRSHTVRAVQPAVAKPGKRKWHEKFRESRNMKT
jgi:hypothetical protein